MEHLKRDFGFEFVRPRLIYNKFDGTYIKINDDDSNYSKYEKSRKNKNYYTARSTVEKLDEIRKKHGMSS